MVLIVFLSSALTVFAAYNFINYLQLNSYSLFKTIKNYLLKHAVEAVGVFVLSLIFLTANLFISETALKVALYIFFCVFTRSAISSRNRIKKRTAKTPLVFTNRIKRLYAVLSVFCTAVFFAAYFILRRIDDYIIFAYIFSACNMLAYAISAAIIKPFERLNNRRYIKKAVKKLDGFERLFRIGITGSYGKTSVKNILYKMLSKKYKTVATDKNYNTPLGIVKTLQKIDGATEIFIVEMGARRKGEIRELCGMVKPHCGVITGITNQHTETFKTLDNVIATKSELYFGRQEGGVCFFNGDDENIIGLPLLNNDDAVVVTTGLRSDGGGATARRAYARAESVVTTTGGCSFILSFGQNFPRRNKLINGDLGDGGQAEGAAFSPTDNSAVSIAVSTRLIGRASVTNISVAAAVAYYLGVSAEEIKQAIEELEPTAHRTEVIRSGDMTIIDDAYNCNPVGAASAIDVLKLFGGRKLVVTCGFAEQGKNLAAENARLGGLIAEAADAVILIGRGGKYIKDGLLERGFAEQSVYEYPSLSEAKKHFPEIFASGDVILFENDMPDNAE